MEKGADIGRVELTVLALNNFHRPIIASHDTQSTFNASFRVHNRHGVDYIPFDSDRTVFPKFLEAEELNRIA